MRSLTALMDALPGVVMVTGRPVRDGRGPAWRTISPLSWRAGERGLRRCRGRGNVRVAGGALVRARRRQQRKQGNDQPGARDDRHRRYCDPTVGGWERSVAVP